MDWMRCGTTIFTIGDGGADRAAPRRTTPIITGRPQEFISAMKWGYLYQGQRYHVAKATPRHTGLWTRARPVRQLHPESRSGRQLVARRSGSSRLPVPGVFEALTALLLLGPGTPMLFQGQEFAASAPFLYFADHNPELAKLVGAKGAGSFSDNFRTLACPESEPSWTIPESEETFQRCKLDLRERETHAEAYALHRDLIEAAPDRSRIQPAPPGWRGRRGPGPEAFVLRYFGPSRKDRLLLVNLGHGICTWNPVSRAFARAGREHDWTVIWSSEDPRYGGCGTPPLETEENWRIPGTARAARRSRRKPASDKTHGKMPIPRRLICAPPGEDARSLLRPGMAGHEWTRRLCVGDDLGRGDMAVSRPADCRAACAAWAGSSC